MRVGVLTLRCSERVQIFHCESDLHLFLFDRFLQFCCKLCRFLSADFSIEWPGRIPAMVK